MTVDDYLGKFPFTSAAREAVADEFDTEDAFNNEVLTRAIERVRNGVDNKNTEANDALPTAKVNLLSYPVARILVSLLSDNRIMSRYAKAEAKTAIKYVQETQTDGQQKFAEFMTKESLDIEDLCSEYNIPIEPINQEEIAGKLGADSFSQLTEDERRSLVEHFDIGTDSVDIANDDPETVLTHISKRTSLARDDPMYKIPVEAYVKASSKLEGVQNSLSNMPLKDGSVFISKEVLFSVLEQLIYADIMDGLPVTVPDDIADSIQVQDAVDIIRHTIDEQYFTFEIDEVNENKFPPCMEALLESTRKGEHLEHNARFALASFLVNIGMTTDEILELFGGIPDFAEDTTRYQINHIRGDIGSTEYTSPSCATLVTQGLCVNKDKLCEKINHPLSYYRIRLKDFGDADELAGGSEESDEADADDTE